MGDFRNYCAGARMESFPNWPGASSIAGLGLRRINCSSKPFAARVPLKDSSITKTTRAPRPCKTEPIPTQLLVGPYAPRSEAHHLPLEALRRQGPLEEFLDHEDHTRPAAL